MSKRVNTVPSERIDKADLDYGFTGFTENEFKNHNHNIITQTPQVLSGFRFRIDDTVARLVTVFNGVSVDSNGQIIHDESGRNFSQTIQVAATEGYHFIEMEFASEKSDEDDRSGWDATAGVNEEGEEYTQTIPTRVTPTWRIVEPIPVGSDPDAGWTNIPGRTRVGRVHVSSGGEIDAPTDKDYPVTTVERVDADDNKKIYLFDVSTFPASELSVRFRGSDDVEDATDYKVTNIDYEFNILYLELDPSVEPGDLCRVSVPAGLNQIVNLGSDFTPRFWLPDMERAAALRVTPSGSTILNSPSFQNVRTLKDFVDAVGYIVDQFNIEHYESDGKHRSVTLPASEGTDQFKQTAHSSDSDTDRKFVIFDKSGTPQATLEIMADGTVHFNQGDNLPSGSEKHLFNIGREDRAMATDESDVRIYRDFSSFVTSNAARLLFGKDVEDVGSWSFLAKTDGVSEGQLYLQSGASVVALFNSDKSVDFVDEVRVGRSTTVTDDFKYSAYKNARYLWTAGDVSSEEQGDGTPEFRLALPALTSGGRAYVSAAVNPSRGMIPLRFPNGVELLQYWVHFNSTYAGNSLDFTLWREGLNDTSDTSSKVRESLLSPSGGFSTVGGNSSRFVNPRSVRTDLDGNGQYYYIVDNDKYNYYMQIVANKVGGALDVDFGGVSYRYVVLNH